MELDSLWVFVLVILLQCFPYYFLELSQSNGHWSGVSGKYENKEGGNPVSGIIGMEGGYTQ